MFIEVHQIQKSFGQGENKIEVLHGIDLSIEKGEFCVLLGPSGSGKSTLLNILGGIDSADSGEISIDGERMADESYTNFAGLAEGMTGRVRFLIETDEVGE